MKALLLLITFFLTATCLAEYRVYQYYVRAKYPMTQDQQAYLATSTLDPVSYTAYHGGGESIEVDLLRTWLCLGNTSRAQYCPAPIDRALEEASNAGQTQGVLR